MTLTTYNERGEPEQSVAPDGIVTLAEFDDLGQQTKLAEDAGVGGKNRTTEFVYNGDGNLWKLIAKAYSSSANDQVTEWVYGTTTPNSGVASNELVSAKKYPDGGNDEVTFEYNRLGALKKFTDQRGTVHEYVYDKLGRQRHDKVTTLPTGVDGAVRRLSLTYNGRGLVERITSSSNPDPNVASVVNEVLLVRNGFGQITTENQDHDSAAGTGSLGVSYGYENGSANTIRRKSITYPSGRVIGWNYGTIGSIDDLVGRVAQIREGIATPALVEYQRRGIRSTVSIKYPEPNVEMTYVGTPGGAGDQYAGIDRFNRIIDIPWKKLSSSTMLDRYQYGFNRASNRFWRRNVVAAAASLGYDEFYAYDGLYQMTALDRGTLNGPPDGISGTPAWSEDFTFDALGNWLTYQTSGTSSLNQTREFNKANEITKIDGSTSKVGYDHAGNMVTMPKVGNWAASAQTLKWDAWNRLVEVTEGSSVLGRYRYDGLFRRIVKESTEAGLWTMRHYYYSDQWQVLEERVEALGATPERQFVWGQRYVDDLVLRDRYPAEPSSSSEWSILDEQFLASSSSSEDEAERLYATHDQWHVTSILDRTGQVQERYAYTGYGESVVLTPAFGARVSSLFGWEVRYGAYRFDPESKLYQVRCRYLHLGLGRWMSRDPIEEEAGWNFYAYVSNGPVNRADPSGLFWGAHIVIAAGIGGLVSGGINAYKGGSFLKGFAAGAVGAGIAAATLNPSAGFASYIGVTGAFANGSLAGAASSALGSLAASGTSALLGEPQSPKTIIESVGICVLTGGVFFGPVGVAVNKFPIGTPVGNVSNVGSISLGVTESALATIPND